MTDFNPFKDKMASDFIDIMCYSKSKQAHLESLINEEEIPAEVKKIAESGKRIGYILRTCSPFTQAEIELAQQAVKILNLNKLVFIIWPFRYINSNSSVLIDGRVVNTTPVAWEERLEILKHGLEYVKDDKLTILESSKEWYIQSKKMEDATDSMNPFWTGAWYVVRKLQHLLNQSSAEKKEFFYCCDEDQFNPNIYPLIRKGEEKIWKDYSILQQLAIHHIFTVPQGANSLLEFQAPSWSPHKVFFGTQLKNKSDPSIPSRANRTINMVNVGCVGGIVTYLIRMGSLNSKRSIFNHE